MGDIGEDGWGERHHRAAGWLPSTVGVSQMHNGLHLLLVQLPIWHIKRHPKSSVHSINATLTQTCCSQLHCLLTYVQWEVEAGWRVADVGVGGWVNGQQEVVDQFQQINVRGRPENLLDDFDEWQTDLLRDGSQMLPAMLLNTNMMLWMQWPSLKRWRAITAPSWRRPTCNTWQVSRKRWTTSALRNWRMLKTWYGWCTLMRISKAASSVSHTPHWQKATRTATSHLAVLHLFSWVESSIISLTGICCLPLWHIIDRVMYDFTSALAQIFQSNRTSDSSLISSTTAMDSVSKRNWPLSPRMRIGALKHPSSKVWKGRIWPSHHCYPTHNWIYW